MERGGLDVATLCSRASLTFSCFHFNNKMVPLPPSISSGMPHRTRSSLNCSVCQTHDASLTLRGVLATTTAGTTLRASLIRSTESMQASSVTFAWTATPVEE